uniref:phospholipase D n=1 Tax=Heterorhabditis bacteriophora TaxID=37862 RepID=A0A1I7XAM2_HETBA
MDSEDNTRTELNQVYVTILDFIDRGITPRMPWHDIHSVTFGIPARDVARHFIQRWNATKTEKLKVDFADDSNYPYLLPKSYENLKVPRVFKNVNFSHNVNIQVLRSLSNWSGLINQTEDSIQMAYLSLIANSKHYIYIENQFFVSMIDSNDVLNEVCKVICNRIIRAYKDNEDFRVYIMIPLLPGFEGNVGAPGGSSLQAVLHWTYQSLSRGPNSLFERLKAVYISVGSLRTHDILCGKLVSELIYIHCKLLIVDDEHVIIGSANINDRSQVGNRDSEVRVFSSTGRREVKGCKRSRSDMSEIPGSSTRTFAPPLPPVLDPDISSLLNDPSNSIRVTTPKPLVQLQPSSVPEAVAHLIPSTVLKNENVQFSVTNPQSELLSEVEGTSTETKDLTDCQKNDQKSDIADNRIDMTGGLMSWLAKTVAENKLLSDVAEKAKAGMESVLTTLDPGMKGFLSVDGVVDLYLASNSATVVHAVKDGFERVFANVLIRTVPCPEADLSPLVVGSMESLNHCRIRATRLVNSKLVPTSAPIFVVQPFVMEIDKRWYSATRCLLRWKEHDVDAIGQLLEVDKNLMDHIEKRSKVDGKPHGQFSITVPQAAKEELLEFPHIVMDFFLTLVRLDECAAPSAVDAVKLFVMVISPPQYFSMSIRLGTFSSRVCSMLDNQEE